MSLDDLVSVTIRATSSGPARSNFGIPLIACQHAVAGALVQSYSSLREAEAAGFTSGSPAHDMLTVAFAQTPRPKTVKIGRRTVWAQVIRITSATGAALANGAIYKGEIDGEEWTYTVSGSADLAAQMTAIASAINALAAAVTADGTSGTHVNVTSTAGTWFRYETTALPGVQVMSDVSTATSIATDLSAFEAADDNWYGLVIDATNETDINAAALWVETRDKIAAFRTHDASVALSASTTDIGADLEGFAYTRTHLGFTRIVNNFTDVFLLAQRLTADPGSDTWAYKTGAGVTADVLSTLEISALEGKNVNYYTEVKGQSITLNGMSPSGEFIDIVRGIDWLKARIQERILGVLTANEKIDYDDGGIDIFAGEILAQLQAGVEAKFLAADPPPAVQQPLAADIDDADKTARLLQNLDFTATIRGAIHRLTINGTLTF